MKHIDDIIKFIESNSNEIINNIDYETIEAYNFLKTNFETSDITQNYLFQFVYRSFYRLDNAGLSTIFKEEYFKRLEENRKSVSFNIENEVRYLYNFLNIKGQNTVQFSFVTKLFNTIDNSFPIYDSEVARMFSFKRPYYKDIDRKLLVYIKQFEIIKSSYEYIVNQKLLRNLMTDFDNRFNFCNLNEIKKLDFIFWAAGKIINKKRYGDDGLHTIVELDLIDKQINE